MLWLQMLQETELCVDLRGPHRPDTQPGLSSGNGNFTAAL